MPTTSPEVETPDISAMTRHQLADAIASVDEAIVSLRDKGGHDLKALSDDEASDLEALADYRDDLQAELAKRPNPGAIKARIDGIGGGRAVSRPNLGGTATEGTGTTPEFKSLESRESEYEKFLKKGPFKSYGHLCHAVRGAGERPGKSDSSIIAEWRDGVLRSDNAVKALFGEDVKASGLNEFSDAEGGLLIPLEFAQGIWQRAMEQENLLQRIPQIPVTGTTLRVRAYQDKSRADGSRYGGVAGYWTAEAAQYQASKPTFRYIDLKLAKLTVLVYTTDEMLDDMAAMSSEIQRVASEEFTFKINDALIRGVGSGMPVGLLKAPAKVTVAAVSGQGASTIIGSNIDDMWARRAKPNGQDYIWLANQDTERQLAQLNYTVAGTNSIAATWLYLPAGGITNSPTAMLKGRPVLFIEQAETLGTEGDLILFDPTQYACIVKNTGIQSAVSMHLRFDYGEQAFRFSFRMDAQPYWETSLTRFKGTNALSPIITLNSTRT